MRLNRFLCSFLSFFVLTPMTWAALGSREFQRILPSQVIASVEIENGRQFYQELFSSAAWKNFQSSAAFAEVFDSPDMRRFEAGRRSMTAFLGSDPVELALQTLGARVDAALWQDSKKGIGAGIVAQPERGTDLREVLERLSDLAEMSGKEGFRSEHGLELMDLEKATLAVGDGILVLASEEQIAVDLATAWKRKGQSPPKPGPASVHLGLDLEALRRLKGRRVAPPDPKETLPILIAGGLARVLQTATELHVRADFNPAGLRFEAMVTAGTDMMDELSRPIYAPEAAGPALTATGDEILSLSLARDFGLFWRQRRQLLPQRLLPGLVEAENVLAVFFSGPPEEVFDNLEPRLSILVAPQDFQDALETPELLLPGFALLAAARQPESLGPRLDQAFQTGVILSNVERAKKGGAPLSLENETLPDGTRLLHARFLTPSTASSEPGALRHNVSPACGMRNGGFVLSSSKELSKRLLMESNKVRKQRQARSVSDLLVVHTQPLARAIEEAKPLLVTNQMIKEGKSREEATRDLNTFIALMDSLESLRAELSYFETETRFSFHITGRQEMR